MTTTATQPRVTAPRSGKPRFAVVGTGGRAITFLDPMVGRFGAHNELVALCDVNQGRMDHYNRWLDEKHHHAPVPTFHPRSFKKMIRQTKPDVVIVTTVDAFHHKYIIAAMEAGCDAVTEKPMTIDAPKCRAILDAMERTGRTLRVTFNYRWAPGTTLVKKLLMQGTIGQIIHADMEYLLNTDHGADYFRRWHREKDKSGGLMVHKATHHFDLVNWWLDAVPGQVFGHGRLAFYGKANARQRGVDEKYLQYDRYTGHAPDDDPFKLDISKIDGTRKLYLDNEKHDGYLRDRNVFADDITIEDTMSLLVKYRTGVVLNYSLNAYLPREGFYVVFNGTKGRLEYQEVHASHIIAGQSAADLSKPLQLETQCVVQPMFGQRYAVEIPKAEGGHGGSDPLLTEQIFSPNAPEEHFGRNAGARQGAASILIGIAANQCFKTGKPVQIDKLCPQLGKATHLSELY